MEKISKHISWREGCTSVIAKRYGIDNCPKDDKIIKRMKKTAEAVFEPLREHFNVPIKINSFYRSKKLNRLIGGSPTSDHVKGRAIDIDDTYSYYLGVTNKDFFDWLKENVNFDQLIWELGTDDEPDWVHIGYRGKKKNRHQILKAYRTKKGKVKYKLIGYGKKID